MRCQLLRTAEMRDIRSLDWRASSNFAPEVIFGDYRSFADLHPAVPPSGETCPVLCLTLSVSGCALSLPRPCQRLRPDAASNRQVRGRVGANHLALRCAAPPLLRPPQPHCRSCILTADPCL